MRPKRNVERVRFYRGTLFYLMKHEDGYHVDWEGCGETEHPLGRTVAEALVQVKAQVDYRADERAGE